MEPAAMNMQDLEGYKELMDKMLDTLPAEQVLSHYAPEQRLAGLDPEQRLAGLDPEQRLAGLDRDQVSFPSLQRATDCPECRHVRSEPDANEVDVTTKLTWYGSRPPAGRALSQRATARGRVTLAAGHRYCRGECSTKDTQSP
jgi:hypothetical protein